MKIKRAALTDHLEKISCGGQISGVVFQGAYKTQALKEDHLLLVMAPPLPEVEPLSEEIGIADLQKFIRALGWTAGTGNEGLDVVIRVEDHRLVIDEEHRGTTHLLTANPSTVGTRIEDATVEKLMEKAPDGDPIPLSQSLISSVKTTYAGLKVSEIELTVGPKGGKISVGTGLSDFWTRDLPELKADEEYSLLFGEHLVDVLSVITNFADAHMKLGGPKNFIMVEDGDYRYLLSPRDPGADA